MLCGLSSQPLPTRLKCEGCRTIACGGLSVNENKNDLCMIREMKGKWLLKKAIVRLVCEWYLQKGFLSKMRIYTFQVRGSDCQL